jgi:hypothetical protein
MKVFFDNPELATVVKEGIRMLKATKLCTQKTIPSKPQIFLNTSKVSHTSRILYFSSLKYQMRSTTLKQ